VTQECPAIHQNSEKKVLAIPYGVGTI
jgi:hypothetical protein